MDTYLPWRALKHSSGVCLGLAPKFCSLLGRAACRPLLAIGSGFYV